MSSESNKRKALELRQQGHSLMEISSQLRVAKSTISDWLHGTDLNPKALERIQKRRIIGYQKSAQTKKLKRERNLLIYEKEAVAIVHKQSMDESLAKLLTSLLYYCEGAKGKETRVTFINSDPNLIALFLTLFRKAFSVDEKKFRVLMHLHSYHNESSQIEFWQKITHIPKNKFLKTFWKPNTGKRTRDSYPGCVSIRYYDAIIAKKLSALYQVAAKSFLNI